MWARAEKNMSPFPSGHSSRPLTHTLVGVAEEDQAVDGVDCIYDVLRRGTAAASDICPETTLWDIAPYGCVFKYVLFFALNQHQKGYQL